MLKTLRGSLVAGTILCAASLSAPAYADNYVAKDGNGNPITFAAKLIGGLLHPFHVQEGLIGGTGNPQAVNVDASGNVSVNCAAGCAGSGTSTLANASPTTVTEGSTTTPLSLDLSRNLRTIATQSGTWNITNISGTISLPTGAATSANQTGGGQKTQIVDGSGNVIGSTSNNLNVQCANCSGSGVSTADGATFTAGSSLFAGSGGIYQTTVTSNPLTAGKQGFVQLTQYRALMANLRDSAGNEILGTASDTSSSNTVFGALLGIKANSAGPIPAQSSAGVRIGGIEGVTGAAVTPTENPIYSGGRAATTLPTAVTDGQKVAEMRSKDGKAIVDQFAPDELRVRGFATSTVNTAVTLIAAPGAGIGLNIVTVACWNNNATTDALVTFNDSVSTQLAVPHAVGPVGYTLPIPLSVATNTAFTFTVGTATSTVGCMATGYKVH